jgi:hypothetical protein
MPAGSVRALLALMVLGLCWALMLLPEDRNVGIPLYLMYLVFLVLGHFFAAHGHSIAGPNAGQRSPLFLPRGTLRFLMIAGFLGVVGYRYYIYGDWNKLFVLAQPLTNQPELPFIILGGFFIGVVLGRTLLRLLSGPTGPPAWLHDMQSWVALCAGFGLGIEIVVQLIINPSMDEQHRINLPQVQAILAAIVAFYFGARS